MKGLAGYHLIEGDETQLTCRMDSGVEDLNSVLQGALAAGAIIENLEVTKPTLGDVFIELSNRSDSD
jgi:hypothetical protein